MYAKDFKKNKDNDTITLEEIAQLLKDQEYMTIYQKNFDSMISKFEPNSEGRKLKYNSRLCATIMGCKRFFIYNNIRIDLVLKTCKVIFYDCRRHKYLSKLSTRPICYRCQISFTQLKIILDVLERFNFINLRYINGEPFITLNTNFKNDCWVRDLSKRFIKITESAYMKCRNDGIGLYFYSKSSKTIRKNIRQSIIDITLGYNELYPTTYGINNGVTYNMRADIAYYEVPVNLIASMNNMNVTDIRRYLNYMCLKTPIISKHDKVYVDNDISKHYVNDRYSTDCWVEDIKNVELEEGHPPVTENSIILHWEPFKNSKYYNRYLKNRNRIKSDIERYIKVKGVKEDLEEDFNETAYINKLTKKHSKQFNLNNEQDEREAAALELLNPEHATGYITTQKSLQFCQDITSKPYMLNKNIIDNMEISELFWAMKNTLENIMYIGKRALKRQGQQLEYIIKRIPKVVWDLAKQKPKLARKWKKRIEYYTSGEGKSDMYLAFIKIDLPYSIEEQIEELTNYLESIKA